MKNTRRFCLMLFLFFWVVAAQDDLQAQDSTLLRTFDVPEARQGIGVDENYFYAVDLFS